MEENSKLSEVITTVLIPSYADIRILLQKLGYDTSGFILYCNNPKTKFALLRFFQSIDCVKGTVHGTQMPFSYNYQMVYIEYQSKYNTESISSFLTNQEYLPVLIVSGIFPLELQGFPIVSFDNIPLNTINIESTKALYISCIDFIHQNPKDILHNIKSFQNIYSATLMSETNHLKKALLTSAFIFNYVMSIVDKNALEPKELISIINDILETDIEEDFEIMMPFRSCINKFIEKNNDKIMIGATKQINNNLWNAIQEEVAILYDDEFYYFSDKLLKEATTDLLLDKKYVQIKKLLKTNDILVCNNTDGNYTIKKTLCNIHGETTRNRFIKIRRSALDNYDELTLKERSLTYVSRTN